MRLVVSDTSPIRALAQLDPRRPPMGRTKATPPRTVGQAIADRPRRNLSQATAAQAAGMTASHWADMEHDRGSPRVATLERLAAVLGCKPRDLVP